MKVSVLSVEEVKVKRLVNTYVYQILGFTEYKVTGRDELGNQHSFSENSPVNIGDELEFVPKTWKDIFSIFYEGPTITIGGIKYRRK